MIFEIIFAAKKRTAFDRKDGVKIGDPKYINCKLKKKVKSNILSALVPLEGEMSNNGRNFDGI